MRIKFLDFDLADSRECKDDFLQITDKEVIYIEEFDSRILLQLYETRVHTESKVH